MMGGGVPGRCSPCFPCLEAPRPAGLREEEDDDALARGRRPRVAALRC